jgi:hypothetical protein
MSKNPTFPILVPCIAHILTPAEFNRWANRVSDFHQEMM